MRSIRHGFTDEAYNWAGDTIVGDIAAIEAAQDAAQAEQDAQDAIRKHAARVFAAHGVDLSTVAKHYRAGGRGMVLRFCGAAVADAIKTLPAGWNM